MTKPYKEYDTREFSSPDEYLKYVHDEHLRRVEKINKQSRLMTAVIILAGLFALFAPLLGNFFR